MVDDPDRPRDEALLLALGRAIDELGGRYLAAEDVGATPRDMDVIARVTPWVTGLDEALGGSGDPSPVTAVGVRAAMRAVRDALDGDAVARRPATSWCTASGTSARISRGCSRPTAHVLTLADRAPGRAEALAAELGAAVVAPDAALDLECDVLAPCALGPVIDLDRVDALAVPRGLRRGQQPARRPRRRRRARGARHPLRARLRGERGRDHQPRRGARRGGYSRERALARAEQIEATTAAVLARAHADGVRAGPRRRGPRPRAHRTRGQGLLASRGLGPWRT